MGPSSLGTSHASASQLVWLPSALQGMSVSTVTSQPQESVVLVGGRGPGKGRNTRGPQHVPLLSSRKAREECPHPPKAGSEEGAGPRTPRPSPVWRRRQELCPQGAMEAGSLGVSLGGNQRQPGSGRSLGAPWPGYPPPPAGCPLGAGLCLHARSGADLSPALE